MTKTLNTGVQKRNTKQLDAYVLEDLQATGTSDILALKKNTMWCDNPDKIVNYVTTPIARKNKIMFSTVFLTNTQNS